MDILCKLALETYVPCVMKDKWENKQLLVKFLNALYRSMVASLLYYRKFTRSLMQKNFMMNPYNPCVWNKNVSGKQLTICFHVDDCKLSHVSPQVLDDTMWLQQDYESIFEDGNGAMKVARGKKHKYLGMNIDFSTKGQVIISMSDYMKEIVTAWDEASSKCQGDGFKVVKCKTKGKTSTIPEDLFKVDESFEKMKSGRATIFNIVAKTMFATKRARPDTLTAIAFLAMRVGEPNIDDWRKLQHLMEYL